MIFKPKLFNYETSKFSSTLGRSGIALSLSLSCSKVGDISPDDEEKVMYRTGKTDSEDSLQILMNGLVDLQFDSVFVDEINDLYKEDSLMHFTLDDLKLQLDNRGYSLVDSMKKSIFKWGDSSNINSVSSLIDGFTTDSFRKPVFYIPFGDSINLTSNTAFYYFDTSATDPIVGKKLNSDGNLVNVTINKSYASSNPVWMMSALTNHQLDFPLPPQIKWPWRRCYCSRGGKPNPTSTSMCIETHATHKADQACSFCGRANWKSTCPSANCIGC